MFNNHAHPVVQGPKKRMYTCELGAALAWIIGLTSHLYRYLAHSDEAYKILYAHFFQCEVSTTPKPGG